MNWKRNSILVLSLCLLFSANIFAQTRNNSPYSIYGITDLSDYSNPIGFAMGGVGISYQDNASINPTNPASFASFAEKSFVFDAGFTMNSSKLSSTSISEKASYATLNHLLFGFQLAKKWKTSIGLLPFSDVGYNINTYEDNIEVGEINHIYTGKGGLTKAYWANAFNICNNLSFGVETGFLFGEIERSHLMLLAETENVFHTKQSDVSNYSDFYFKFGVQYKKSIKENLNLTLGAIYSFKTEINTDSTSLIQLVQRPVAGVTDVVETIDENTISGQTTLPAVFGFGLMLTKKNHWKVGLDFEKQFWSKFKALNGGGTYKNSTRMAIGAEYIPDKSSVFSYYKRIRYRAGFRYEKTPLYINGEQINEFGISFGVGLPLRRSLSSINMGLEIGQKGKMSNNLIKDTFIRFKLGVSMFHNNKLNNIWF